MHTNKFIIIDIFNVDSTTKLLLGQQH